MPTVEDILRKHWLNGNQETDPQPLTEDEVAVLCEQLPEEYAPDQFENRGGGKMWHTETWYDFRNDEWMRDENGKTY